MNEEDIDPDYLDQGLENGTFVARYLVQKNIKGLPVWSLSLKYDIEGNIKLVATGFEDPVYTTQYVFGSVSSFL